jgi:tetratricopeptide (TPR) repeat protein
LPVAFWFGISCGVADRLAELRKHLDREPDDPFLRYGIAMEHKKAGAFDEALRWFDKTLEVDATYAYAHYQKGQVHEAKEDTASARKAYEEGVVAATKCNDQHAVGEMQVALDLLED